MKSKVLCIVLAMILCLTFAPVSVFAVDPLYDAEIIETQIPVDSVGMSNDGLVQYSIYDEDYEHISEVGLLNSKGEYIYVRYPEWRYDEESDDYNYQYLFNFDLYSYGNYILDGNDCRRYAKSSSIHYQDYEEDDLYWYSDYKIVSKKDGKVYYCSDIIANYWGCNAGEIYIYSVEYCEDENSVVVNAAKMDSEYNVLRDDYYYISMNNLSVQRVVSTQIGGDYAAIWPLSDGLMSYRVYDDNSEFFKKIGYLDKAGKIAISLDPNQYSYNDDFSDGLACVEAKTSQKYGFIDKSGKLVIPCTYKWADPFQDGYACVQNSRDKYGVIDKSGNTVIPFEWDYLRNASDGLFIAENYDDDSTCLIDKNGTKIVYGAWRITECRNNTLYAFDSRHLLQIIKLTPNNGNAPSTVSTDVSSIFKDVPSSAWYKTYLQNAYNNGIVGGMSANMYGPQNKLTHAQILVIVANLHSLQKGDQYDFSAHSVPGDHWCSAFLNYCKAEGIIDNRFDNVLNNNVNRGEMAYYFANALTNDSYVSKKNVNFADISGNPYAAAINKLASADIVGGYSDGSYKPGNLVTRAEVSVFVSNIIDAIFK